MRFVVDECIGPVVADFLKKLGEPVDYLCDHVPEGTKDTVWIPKLFRLKLIVITRDYRMGKKITEAKLFRRHNGRGFAVAVKDEGRVEVARQVLMHWEKIKSESKKLTPPFFIRISRSGDSWDDLLEKSV